MKGVIKDCCVDGRRFAIVTETGFVIFYSEQGGFDWGDAVEGRFPGHGPAVLYNQCSGRTLDIFIEAAGDDPANIDFHLNLRR